jgi:hypothetical protein
MSSMCDADATRLTAYLGFRCAGANPLVTLRNPFDLTNATMPVLELLIVAGAVFAFVHAWRRWRRDGDPVNISLWFASLVYLAVVEPPLYFPTWFGLEDKVGFVFAHNVFTVQFMYDRLPLYIVAFYPVISQLSYELVRVLGIFERHRAAVGAIGAAFASQVFYETFDQLGPQLKWWAWNTRNAVNRPMLDAVPMNSMWVFASVSFGVLVWLVVRLVGVRPDRPRLSGRGITARTVAAGVLTPVLMVVGATPTRAGGSGDHTLQRVLITVLLALLWACGLWLLVQASRRGWRGPADAVASPSFARIYPALYIAVLTGLWISALPALLDARHGVTPDGTPTGSAWYALGCIAVSLWFVVAALRATRTRTPAPAPVAVPA